ncbi:MAG: hypothetical protein GC164_09475 [Phycisphaera sp.]|nr:hypothetical protein [Phycisphaera sp.]
MKRHTGKIFAIGFQKTGTTSLGAALELLGYDVCGYVSVCGPDFDRHIRKVALAVADEYDAFQDNPWALLYRELDERHPGSKFILTLRDEQSWLRSVLKHFGSEPSDMQKWIYGYASPKGHEEAYLNRYRAHNARVLEYFARRPDDLIVMKLTRGEGWEKLCPFLGCQTPQCDFPRLNTAAGRSWWRSACNRVVRKARTLTHTQKAA